MESLKQILEEELENSFEVRDKKALHRSVLLLVENLTTREQHDSGYQTLNTKMDSVKSDVQLLTEAMIRGFENMQKQMDLRFEARGKESRARFEAIDKRFEDMTSNMNDRFEATQKQMDERFSAVDRRFTLLTVFLSVGFSAILAAITTFNFL